MKGRSHSRFPRPRVRAAGALLAVALLGGCATRDPADPRDPLESYNRTMFRINHSVDRAVLRPVAVGYRDVVPAPVRQGIGNFFGNLDDVWSMLNDFAQLHVVEGLNMFMRVGVNTIFGMGGIADPSTEMGLYKQPNDLGLTLARYGVGSGPYFVMPLFGPRTLRDAGGTLVDLYEAPMNYATTNNVAARNVANSLQFIDLRAGALATTDLIDQVSIDPYVFTRDAYLQRRDARVAGVRAEGVLDPAPPDTGGADADPQPGVESSARFPVSLSSLFHIGR